MFVCNTVIEDCGVVCVCVCVCQSLDPELEAELGRIGDTAPKYGVWTKIKVFTWYFFKFYNDQQIWNILPQLNLVVTKINFLVIPTSTTTFLAA